MAVAGRRRVRLGRVEGVQVDGGQLGDDGPVRDGGSHAVHSRATRLVRARVLHKYIV